MKSPPELKRLLRAEARTRRDGLDASWRKEASGAIARRVFELPELESVHVISMYLKIGSEVETEEMIRSLIQMKGGVALPRFDRDSGLLEHRWLTQFDKKFFRPGAFGILEPDPETCEDRLEAGEIELNFLPGLAFDLSGNRLGMGGGHYDRYLAASPESLKFGLAFSHQILKDLPVEPTDIRLNGLVTEERIYRFSNGKDFEISGK